RLLAVFKGALDEHDWLKPQRQAGKPGENDRLLPYVTSVERKTWEAGERRISAQIEELKQKPKSKDVDAQIKVLEASRKPQPLIRALWDRGEPTPTYLLRRGNYLTPGRPVSPGAPAVLSADGTPLEIKPPWPDGAKTGRRLAFARWLTRPAHPLTARVMVNRIWHHHFGSGLVKTLDNFGKAGARPTHPQLLDYLAVRFVEDGWSLKAMHRRMLLSSTYRMSSRVSADARRIDPENKLLSHMPLRRLEAEPIHDAILTVTGSLDRTVGGPSIPPFVSPNATANKPVHIPKSGPVDSAGRRAIYVLVRRNFITPMFQTFDFPSPAASVGRRDVTIVPAQALTMLNGPLVHRQSSKWATAVAAQSGSNEEKIARMFVRALGRPPSSNEREALLSILAASENEKPWADVAHVILNLNDFVFVR
ncbi:MAG: DUF1553 domain-containing protein, partial [Planctomycetes bacterium]|nr:DUF1553 domain-containing protein [Planctomycetota bacterium]